MIRSQLGIQAILANDRYLGLPMFMGRSKNAVFAGIKHKVWNRVRGWKENFLSQAGWEVLIKSVAQAIPTYAMSCFRLPSKLLHEINSVLSQFWWGQRDNERKIHWLSWKFLCRSKRDGGMGFRDFEAFNTAMLAKQGWRLIHNTNSFAYSVLRAKYFPNGSFLDTPCPSTASATWKSLCSARNLLRRGSTWRIGDGCTARVWGDIWAGKHALNTDMPTGFEDVRVAALMDESTGGWDRDLVLDIFDPVEARVILNIPLLHSKPRDKLVWTAHKSGFFSVKSAYFVAKNQVDDYYRRAMQPGVDERAWRRVWDLDLPCKFRIFLWRFMHNILPTRRALCNRGLLMEEGCFHCNAAVIEDMNHVFILCPIASEVWELARLSINIVSLSHTSMADWVAQAMLLLKEEEVRLFVVVLWTLWSSRNRVRIGKSTLHPTAMVLLAKGLVSEFASIQRSRCASQYASQDHWTPPPAGLAKVNCDGATGDISGVAAFGIVIRNDAGLVLAAMSGRCPGAGSPPMVECLAILEGLKLAKRLNLEEVIIESDALAIIKDIGEVGDCLTPYGHIVEEIRRDCSGFSQCMFFHVSRLGNEVAHGLAHFGLSCLETVTWRDSYPSFLLPLLSKDVISSHE